MQVLVHLTHNPLRNLDYLVACPETGHALAIDPWEAQPLLEAARARGWEIRAILNTHEHGDHTQGNRALHAATRAPIWCHHGAVSSVPGAQHGLRGGDVLRVGRLELEVLDTPGHTMSHVGLLGHADTPALFSGDTLFNAGAGNCHNGGEPRALYRTFRDRLVPLPDHTRLYPGHDYRVNNLRFTLSREPGNEVARALLAQAEQAEGAWHTATLGEERQVNTFFRLRSAEVAEGLRRDLPDQPSDSDEERFVALRALRNRW